MLFDNRDGPAVFVGQGFRALSDEIDQRICFKRLVCGQGRIKSLHSIYRKMMRKNVPLEGVFDTLALRIVIDDSGGKERQAAVQACYRVLPVVQRLWKPLHEEFDDYILEPKASGYQSLHTTVMGKAGMLRTSLCFCQLVLGSLFGLAFVTSVGSCISGLSSSECTFGAPVSSGGVSCGRVLLTLYLLAVATHLFFAPCDGVSCDLLSQRNNICGTFCDCVQGHPAHDLGCLP